MIKRIHHINFLVRDLEQAIARYQSILGLNITQRDELPGRGVKIARVLLGETWLVLVQPTDPSGVPGQHLARHGEGFFLISYQVEDLQGEADRASGAGFDLGPLEPRQGLDDWQVLDLPAAELFGASSQWVVSDPGAPQPVSLE